MGHHELKKILLVFGTRPEAIKMAPLVHELKAHPRHFEVAVCVTAQHREMLDQVLDVFCLTPDMDLNLMRDGQSLAGITSQVLLAMIEVFENLKPDIVLVHGDTTTSMASAMAAFYTGVQVGHIEAGLRTYDLSAPFPEEFNRQVVGKLARWHFAPTLESEKNLISEGVKKKDILVTGNTVVDALYWMLGKIDSDRDACSKLKSHFSRLLTFELSDKRFVLVTGHRRENFGDGFAQICEAIKFLATENQDLHFVYPVHLNPNIQVPAKMILGNLDNVHLIEPLEYEPFVFLLRASFMVLTDSGGIQEEAPSLGKPVLVMRDVTERPEAIEAGTVELVGANKERIIDSVSKLLSDRDHYLKMSRAHNPYGDGLACKRIVEFLKC